MVDIKDVLSFNYYTYKKPFTGSDNGKRYRIVRLEKEVQAGEGTEPEKEVVFKAFLAFEKTPEEEILTKEFDFTPSGLEQVVDWINTTML